MPKWLPTAENKQMPSTPGLKPRSVRFGIAAIGVLSLLAGTGQAAAQANYPEKVIRIVAHVTSGPGPITARMIGDRLAARWGQPVVVEPKVGAGGNIAAGFVAKASRSAASECSV